MSFLSSVFELGKKAVKFLSGDSIGANIAKTVISGLAVKKINKAITRPTVVPPAAAREPERGIPVDEGVRLQVDPDPNHAVPVVYGTATLGGAITDVHLEAQNTLYVVFTICERTGVKLSDGQQSVITFDEIRLNDQRVIFKTGGQTVDSTVDRDGAVDNSADGLIEIRCFNNGSNSPVRPQGFNSGGNIQPASQFIPTWTSTDTMDQLVFVVVKFTYNRDRGVTRIPEISIRVSNSMRLPGDCVRDYMTNTRYGAGIPPQEIYSE